MSRKLAFSVTKDDLVIQTFRAGGKGGQKQNKTESGVRITHPPSGAVGEARDGRSQWQNKKVALRRMAARPEFKFWCEKMIRGYKSDEEYLEEAMQEKNLRTEIRENGRWTEVSQELL